MHKTFQVTRNDSISYLDLDAEFTAPDFNSNMLTMVQSLESLPLLKTFYIQQSWHIHVHTYVTYIYETVLVFDKQNSITILIILSYIY